jgi:hypothetical protein
MHFEEKLINLIFDIKYELPGVNFGWNPELVRAWTCFGFTLVPTTGNCQSPDSCRAFTAKGPGCAWLLSGGTRRLLQEVRGR